MKCAIVAALLLPLAAAHLCLLTPLQRGTMNDIMTPGTDDCKLITKDCGGRDPGPPTTTLWAGMKANIIFQKNLDHFNKDKPGSFVVNLGVLQGGSRKWTMLSNTKDSNTTSLYLYESMVDIPNMEMERAVIQVIYTTSNPEAPAAFYQCADVSIKKPPHV